MLARERILKLFELLSDELGSAGEFGEIGIVGGAVMCLVYQTRNATKDIDAVFEPAGVMRKLIGKVGAKEALSPDWLNDAVKGFLVADFKRETVVELPHLRVWAPEPQYMLAMKCISARWDTFDQDDVRFLIQFLKLNSARQVFDILESYYPKHRIPAKTQYFIEEVMEAEKPKRKKSARG